MSPKARKTTMKPLKAGQFSLEAMMESMEKQDMDKMVRYLLGKNQDISKDMLEWYRKKIQKSPKKSTKTEAAALDDALMMKYWCKAEDIICEFNEYGGGPDEMEFEGSSWLEKISRLVKSGNTSSEGRLKLMDSIFVEYDMCNSGFEDELIELCFELCRTKKEWQCLVDKLNRKPTNWRSHLVKKIYKKHLKDEKAYVRTLSANLQYGSDFRELAEYYYAKGDVDLALETAESCMSQEDHHCMEAFEFLIDHYGKVRDLDNIRRLADIGEKREFEAKKVLDMAFKHFRRTKDYESAKDVLLRGYDHAVHKDFYSEYKRMKGYLKREDWEELEPRIFHDIKQKNTHDYLRICLDKNMKREVLDVILNPPKNRWGYITGGYFDEFAEKLEGSHPEGVIEYYTREVNTQIEWKTRKTYAIAASYLVKIKRIYIRRLKRPKEWNTYLKGLNDQYRNRPAFLDEIKDV